MTEKREHLVSRRTLSVAAEWRDLILVILGVVGTFLLAGYFDVSEWWAEWVEDHEEWELDELPMMLSLASIGIAVFAYRKWQDSKSMARLLNQSNDILEKRVAERTATVEAQTAELERALKTQIEYNELHREFISMASHEFRTPLTIIDGSAQRILRTKDRISMDEIARRLGDIRSASVRMVGLIDSTLSAEQLDAGRIKMSVKRVDLTEVLTVVQARQLEVTPSHRIELDFADVPDEIQGDPKLLEQVFANLLSNAAKYSSDDRQIEVTGRKDGENVVIAVSDRGLGVPASELPRLFQRYFRASTTIGIAGTGIGLHVVKKFVEMHGGSVRAKSVEGEGTTFTVQLPIAGPGEQQTDSDDGVAPLTRTAATAAA